jgi:hypothetical protein
MNAPVSSCKKVTRELCAAGLLSARVAAIGEPFLCGFDPATLPQELAALGFDLLDDLSDTDLLSRYDPQGRNALRSSRHSRIARARVR